MCCDLFLFPRSEADLADDPVEAWSRLRRPPRGRRLPGSGGVPATKDHLVAGREEAQAQGRGQEIIFVLLVVVFLVVETECISV